MEWQNFWGICKLWPHDLWRSVYHLLFDRGFPHSFFNNLKVTSCGRMNAPGDSLCVCNLPYQVVMSATHSRRTMLFQTFSHPSPCCILGCGSCRLKICYTLANMCGQFICLFATKPSLFSRNKVSTCLFSFFLGERDSSFLFLCLLWHILELKPLQVTNLKSKSPLGPQWWVEKTIGLTSCLLCCFSSCWLYFPCLVVCAEISCCFSCSLGLSLTLRQFFGEL